MRSVLANLYAVAAAAVLFTACGKEIDCPATDARFRNFFPATPADQLIYLNQAGDSLVFRLTNKQVSGSYSYRCAALSPKPECGSCSESAGFNAEISGDTHNFQGLGVRTYDIGISTTRDQQDMISVHHGLLNFQTNLLFDRQFRSLNPGLLQHDSLLVNGHLYRQVFEVENEPLPYSSIWKAWITASDGIIQFQDTDQQIWVRR